MGQDDGARQEALEKAIAGLREAVGHLRAAGRSSGPLDGIPADYARKIAIATTNAETALLWARDSVR